MALLPPRYWREGVHSQGKIFPLSRGQLPIHSLRKSQVGSGINLARATPFYNIFQYEF